MFWFGTAEHIAVRSACAVAIFSTENVAFITRASIREAVHCYARYEIELS